MSDVALDNESRSNSLPGWRSALILLVAIIVAFAIAWIVPGGTDYPSSAVIPFAEWIGAVMQWLKVTFTAARDGASGERLQDQLGGRVFYFAALFLGRRLRGCRYHRLSLRRA
ncbi:MAG: hypothetical protein E6G89_04665 [Alphaproteobacteria bacterium]|nr:MAG: hypothetical protein E6G89_04665 [Alphaproteobacteria bacterium]